MGEMDGYVGLWFLRSLSLSHFSEGRIPGPHAFPTLPKYPNPQRPGLTTCHPGTEYFIRVQVLSAPRRKREGEIERGNPDQTPDPSLHWSPGHLPYWAKEDFMRSLRAPGGGGWEQQRRAGGYCFPSTPQVKALSLDHTLSSKGCSTLLWEALADSLPAEP